jgi:hypothetical protein
MGSGSDPDNLWAKTQSAIVWLQQEYGGQFDWFVKGDDDTLLFVENLRHYLASQEVAAERVKGEGVYVGRRMNTTATMLHQLKKHAMAEPGATDCPECCVFCAGGPTYSLDAVALRRLAGVVMTCMPGERSHADDHFLGCCLQKRLGVVALDTRDENGGERFLVHPPDICVQYVTCDSPAVRPVCKYACLPDRLAVDQYPGACCLPPAVCAHSLGTAPACLCMHPRSYQLPDSFQAAIEGADENSWYFAYSYDPPRFVPRALGAHCSPDAVGFHQLPGGAYKAAHDLFYRCLDWDGFDGVEPEYEYSADNTARGA